MSHTDRAHAKLAPSSAHRWLNCPGSIRLAEGLEEAPSQFADEGTAAHQLAEMCLTEDRTAEEFKGHTITVNGRGYRVDDEMVDAVQLYVDTVHEIADGAEEFAIEQRMDMTEMVEGVWGTGDTIAYRSTPTRRVTICDLKYGRGVIVEVEENEQLLTYAMGVAQRYHNRGIDEIELVVVQPRAFHRDGPVRRWVADVVTLYEHVVALHQAQQRVADPDAALNPGDWCKFCKAEAICPAKRDAVTAMVGANLVDGEIVGMADPAKYSPEELAQALRNLPAVLSWYKSVESFAHAEAVKGRVAPGFKLVGKRAFRKWKSESDALAALQLLGVDEGDIFETTMRSPAQVEKAIPKKERGVIADLAVAQSSGTVLAPLNDPRASVDPNDARGFEATEIEDR